MSRRRRGAQDDPDDVRRLLSEHGESCPVPPDLASRISARLAHENASPPAAMTHTFDPALSRRRHGLTLSAIAGVVVLLVVAAAVVAGVDDAAVERASSRAVAAFHKESQATGTTPARRAVTTDPPAVLASGLDYRRADLGAQIDDVLTRRSVPTAADAPAADLPRCLERFGLSATDTLVDAAHFEGRPALVLITTGEDATVVVTSRPCGLDSAPALYGPVTLR